MFSKTRTLGTSHNFRACGRWKSPEKKFQMNICLFFHFMPFWKMYTYFEVYFSGTFHQTLKLLGKYMFWKKFCVWCTTYYHIPTTQIMQKIVTGSWPKSLSTLYTFFWHLNPIQGFLSTYVLLMKSFCGIL